MPYQWHWSRKTWSYPPPWAQRICVYILSPTASVAMGSIPITKGATSLIIWYGSQKLRYQIHQSFRPLSINTLHLYWPDIRWDAIQRVIHSSKRYTFTYLLFSYFCHSCVCDALGQVLYQISNLTFIIHRGKYAIIYPSRNAWHSFRTDSGITIKCGCFTGDMRVCFLWTNFLYTRGKYSWKM